MAYIYISDIIDINQGRTRVGTCPKTDILVSPSLDL